MKGGVGKSTLTVVVSDSLENRILDDIFIPGGDDESS
jgi:cellulose biosynthesis protein BcsQ